MRDICEDNNENKLVGAIIAMGGSLSLQIVAEGVERPEQAQTLRRMGCHFAQGYFFSRPVPAEAFPDAAEWVAERLAKLNV